MEGNWIEKLRDLEAEVRTIGQLVHRFGSGDPRISKISENVGDYPAIICRDVFGHICIRECGVLVGEGDRPESCRIDWGDILVAHGGYTDNNSEGCCVYLGNKRPLAGNNIHILKHGENPKYLINYLLSDSAKRQINGFLIEYLWSSRSLLLKDIKRIEVPVPPKDIQEKIGDFLFSFIEYGEKLKGELEGRRRQFDFYREKIFGEVMEKYRSKRIEEMAEEIYSGSGISRDQLEDGGDHPAIRFDNVLHSNIKMEECGGFVDPDLVKNKKYCVKNDLLVSDISVNLKNLGRACVYMGEEKCLVGGRIVVVRGWGNMKYLSYFLSSSYAKDQIRRLCQKGTVYSLYISKIKRLKVPIPPPEEQKRIVDILDKFYGVTEDPNGGIQLLIDHNRRQYEYYRELIFSNLNSKLSF